MNVRPQTATLSRYFEYDPDSGTLIRAIGKRIGEPAEIKRDELGIIVWADGGESYAHEVIWRMFSRKPFKRGSVIKHLNGDVFDNRLENLALQEQP